MSSPESVSCMIVACCILHNIAIRNGQELDLIPEDEIAPRVENQVEEEGGEDIEAGMPRNRLYYRGLRARNEIVESYFNREN